MNKMKGIYKFSWDWGRQGDTEDIPCHKEIPVRLRVVFDAFEEMCLRLKESEGSDE